VAAFLSNIREFNDWKHRQSSSYVEKIKFDEVDCVILGVLKIVSALDFESIVLASQLPADQVQLSLQKLAENHVVEAGDNNFLIAPAVRIAVEKDGRIRLDKSAILAASRAIAASLSLRIEEGGAPFSLLDAAILASIQSGDVLSEFVAAFMLPSHQVWLCRHHYDLKHWSDCIRLGLEALKGASRLSTGAFVAACRYVCLAAARIGRDDIFDEVINKLEKSANDDWGRSNVAYLKGFRARNKGHLLEAESWFYDSYKLSAGNHSALRELAAISLVRGNMEIAETYAREALKNAPTNPYLIDILLSILIRKRGKAANGDREVRDLFDILERVGEEDGRSFYTTRKAEFEYVSGNYSGAASFIRKAIEKTPTLFEPRRIYAEILLKQGNKSKALEVIDVMKNMVAERENSDRRTNYRLYLEVLSKYHLETGNFSEARAVFQDSTVFTQIEAAGFIKKIDIAESFFRHKK
jgi:tetratricopeptide (TPR) repeat protein